MKMKRHQTISLKLAWTAAALTVSLSPMCSADTNYIREFAKNKPRVFIVASGPEAASLGHALQNAILRHMDNKHPAGDLPILSIAQAEQAANSDSGFGKSPVVFLLEGREMSGPLPPTLASILPQPLQNPKQKVSFVTGSLSGEKRQQVFTVEMFAPDAERLQRVYSVFLQRVSADYRALPFQQAYQTNKLALFSTPGDRDIAEGWGRISGPNVWNDLEWHDLSEYSGLTADKLAERAQVFFIDHGLNDPTPGVCGQMLASHTLTPTTIVIDRQMPKSDTGDDGPIAVFCAPSRTILEKKAEHYPNLAALDGVPAEQQAIDLRAVKHTTLLMSGSIPDGEREQVRLLLAKDLRQMLGMEVEERGPGLQELQNEVTLEQLQGATDTSRSLRRKSGLRYVWHFAATDYSGQTEYTHDERRITPAPAPFPDAEPTEPSRSKGLFRANKSDADYAKDMDDYRQKHADWEAKKREYDQRTQNADYQWEREVGSVAQAHVHGILRLIDLQDGNGGKVVWEHDCQGQQERRGTYRSDTVSIQGSGSSPSSLDAPATSDSCPTDLLHSAVHEASASAFGALQETALLPSGANGPAALTASGSPDAGATTAGPSPAAQDAPAKVADIADGVVTLTVGQAQGVRVGSRVVIPLKTRQITDPNTGAVLETRVLDQITLRVSQTGACADCVPATPADAAKLAQVQKGMPAQWTRPAALAATGKPARAAHRTAHAR